MCIYTALTTLNGVTAARSFHADVYRTSLFRSRGNIASKSRRRREIEPPPPPPRIRALPGGRGWSLQRRSATTTTTTSCRGRTVAVHGDWADTDVVAVAHSS